MSPLIDDSPRNNKTFIMEYDRQRMTFTTKWGMFVWLKTPFRLSDDGAVFQGARGINLKGWVN